MSNTKTSHLQILENWFRCLNWHEACVITHKTARNVGMSFEFRSSDCLRITRVVITHALLLMLRAGPFESELRSYGIQKIKLARKHVITHVRRVRILFFAKTSVSGYFRELYSTRFWHPGQFLETS
jgi:hypothetical protein